MIRTRWFLIFLLAQLFILSCAPKNEDILTTKEKEWLKKHPNIKIAVSTTFAPFQYLDKNNKSIGISVDILNQIEENINYQFDKIYFDNWSNILEAGKAGKVDAILEIQETMDRRKYFHFTHPFITLPHSILMRDDAEDHISLDEMENLKIGVVQNYAVHEHIKLLYPELKLVELADDLTCLRELYSKNIDAVITQQGYAIYLIHKEIIPNLKIVGDVGYDNILGIGSRKDWPILTRILDKGLAQITPKEQNAIYNQYIPIQVRPFWQKAVFWIVLFSVMLGLVLSTLVVSIWNKTLRKRVSLKTKELTEAKNKAEESNQLKSSFLANMSHEIRTPLNAIQGFSELISSKDLDLTKKEKFANIINTNCQSLTHLIDEILDLSKIESGQIKLIDQKFELITSINEIISIQQQNIPSHKKIIIQFVNQLQSESFHLISDPFRFKQVLNNLIENGIKFTENGYIRIYASFNSNSEVIFCVEDSGIGIEESALNFIFDRFRKIEIDNTVLYRGSGLGLNICKKLLRLMDGQIWVKSTPGKGSAFYFTLPIKQETKWRDAVSAN
ncbi:transporter substrate-binding domain-containing protein [Marinifilum sp. N1E240]|uniref:ATP-binding protein n=1 Tax=Marinifilum sp. N1E240 TaxID=2608082 RepID=UPI00128C67DD|nr:transporter substrate-binding domain-containing protein [Marinifilum sp. N1E240]MPQ46493.1 transporter substrate-binding domain-containing protein [Marinifilum sp. N1E240]